MTAAKTATQAKTIPTIAPAPSPPDFLVYLPFGSSSIYGSNIGSSSLPSLLLILTSNISLSIIDIAL